MRGIIYYNLTCGSFSETHTKPEIVPDPSSTSIILYPTNPRSIFRYRLTGGGTTPFTLETKSNHPL